MTSYQSLFRSVENLGIVMIDFSFYDSYPKPLTSANTSFLLMVATTPVILTMQVQAESMKGKKL